MLSKGTAIELSSASIARSRLLSDIHATAERPTEATLNIATSALELWLKHIESAADILIDEETEAEACAALAPLLEAECDYVLEKPHNRKPCIALEVLGALSEDLGLKVLRAVHRPLSTLLRYLSPTPFLPLLLRTHHPSIDAAASLHLCPVLAQEMHFTLNPIATLTHLHSLSLAGTPLTHFHDCRPGFQDLRCVLRALPRLTSLCLRDTALRAAADALAAALPALPHLVTLDASGNRLDGAFDALAAALPSALALRTLLLDGAASTPRTLRALASALRRMPHLQALAIGTPCTLDSSASDIIEKPGQPDSCEYTDTNELLLEFLDVLRSMPSLQHLDFNYQLGHVTYANESHVAAAVASLSQLRHLSLRCLTLCNTPISGQQPAAPRAGCGMRMPGAPKGDADPHGLVHDQAEPGAGLSLLTGLTSLDLSAAEVSRGYRDTVGGRGIDSIITALLQSLLALTNLQRLQLPGARLHDAQCAGIMRAVGNLTCLTQVSVRSADGSGADAHGLRCIHALCGGLAEMQHLRHIRVPLIANMHSLEAPDGGDAAAAATAASAALDCRRAATAAAAALVRAHAADDKEVEIDLQCCERPNRRGFSTTREAAVRVMEMLQSVLPLCRSLQSDWFGGDSVQMAVLASSLDRMTVLSRLKLRIDDGFDGELLWGSARCGEPQRLLQNLALLRGLQSLAVVAEMRSFLETSTDFCDQLTHLRQLTNLEVAVQGSEHQFVPRVLASCSGLTCLRRLELRLLSEQPQRKFELDDDDESGPFESGEFESGEFESGDSDAVVEAPGWWQRDGAPQGWAVGGLTSLQTLLVLSHGNLDADEVFWEGLKRLSRLQSLWLNDYFNERQGRMLGYRLRKFGGMALHELHVGARWFYGKRKGAFPLHEAGGERVAFQCEHRQPSRENMWPVIHEEEEEEEEEVDW